MADIPLRRFRLEHHYTQSFKNFLKPAGYSGVATAGNGGAATAGNGGTATAGYNGAATAGDLGIITIRWWDMQKDRSRLATFYVGEDSIKPGVAYRVDEFGAAIELAK